MSNIACFDIGGTGIKYGVLDIDNNIINKGIIYTPKRNCNTKIPEIIIEKINNWKKNMDIEKIAICSAGSIDTKKGIVVYSSAIVDYSNTHLVKIIEENTDINTILENDVNAAAYGEYSIGAGKNRKNFICITIGTSIGASIFIDGKIYTGSNGLAGELGHMIIDIDGRRCGCGNKGCLQSYGSTKALISDYIKLSDNNMDIDGKEIMKRVEAEDKNAKKAFNIFIHRLAIGLANITHILDPELIIIGGGISQAGDEFLIPLKKEYKDICIDSFKDNTDIVKAELGNDAGLIGMNYLARL